MRQSVVIWDKEEREAWQLPKQLRVSEWADQNRILDPLTSSEPGRWRTDRTPYLRGILDAFNDPLVEEIILMKSTQIGGTEAILNMLGYVIDEDPGPALVVLPREADAKSFSKNRVEPMLLSSPTLREHLTRIDDDITQMEYHLDRMILYFAGSNSPSDLAQRPIRYLFLDELDKFPKFSGREADPIKLATERTRTFWNRRIVKCSTPTTRQGYIFREFERSEKHRYYVPCPHCGKFQILVFAQIKWPEEERDPDKIKTGKSAWYECEFCHGVITDQPKPKMLKLGIWCPDGCSVEQDGSVTGDKIESSCRGFWINALYSPWLTFSEIVAEFLDSKDYIEKLMNFVNSWLAEVWEEKTEESRPEILATKALTYAMGGVPAGVLVLTAGVDVQKDHFYFVIRGWGLGEESWLIRASRVESWEEVIDALFKTRYPSVVDGVGPFQVRLTCIDSGYRTDEVYAVCRRWSDIARPVKGQDHLAGVPYRVNIIDRNPRTGEVIPGGLRLWHVDTSYFKDKIYRMVHADPGDPAQWHLCANPTTEYLTQFCSEQKIIIRDRKTGKSREEWRPISAGAKNHYLDVEMCAVAAADMLRVSALRPEGESQVYKPRIRNEEERRPGGWINKRNWIAKHGEGWLKR